MLLFGSVSSNFFWTVPSRAARNLEGTDSRFDTQHNASAHLKGAHCADDVDSTNSVSRSVEEGFTHLS